MKLRLFRKNLAFPDFSSMSQRSQCHECGSTAHKVANCPVRQARARSASSSSSSNRDNSDGNELVVAYLVFQKWMRESAEVTEGSLFWYLQKMCTEEFSPKPLDSRNAIPHVNLGGSQELYREFQREPYALTF